MRVDVGIWVIVLSDVVGTAVQHTEPLDSCVLNQPEFVQ